ncbi:MAG: uroporphyrinogen decarboxylase [Nitrospirota bacterium]|jgi:uroporphyrinogen decarboxylase
MNDTFLKACRGEDVPYTPVWLMRQAGRYMPEYQEVRSQVDFLTLCRTPELAAKVTLQPVDRLGVDAAILFSDILVVAEAMGMKVEFHEKRGPVLADPVRTRSRLERLAVPEPEDDLGYVLETIRILRPRLEDKVPLIGFSGAPFTLSTYMIEGGSSKNFLATKRMMYGDPVLYHDLMERITAAVEAYLQAQIRAGAQAVQIFDSWAGVLCPADFVEFELPYVKRIVKALKKEGVPVIYFVNNCAAILREAKKAGADVLGIDWRIDMKEAVKVIGKRPAVQGNLDPCALFLPREKLRERVRDILEKGRAAKGHIFNLGHGILPETPVEQAQALVEAVHELSGRG